MPRTSPLLASSRHAQRLALKSQRRLPAKTREQWIDDLFTH
jgi:hypothetical protein